MLYIHGGGYVIGSPHSHRALAGKIAKGISANCLLIDYRKAPENPYPAALEDVYYAYTYLLEKGYDIRTIQELPGYTARFAVISNMLVQDTRDWFLQILYLSDRY